MENKETGEQVEDNDFERLKKEGYFKQLGQPISLCQHCYCQTCFIGNKEHLVCCMCGHRMLKNPITY